MTEIFISLRLGIDSNIKDGHIDYFDIKAADNMIIGKEISIFNPITEQADKCIITKKEITKHHVTGQEAMLVKFKSS